MVDTDVGDDIDDVLALALLFQGTEVKVIGISSALGDTPTRSRMLDRLLRETGHTDVPVATGIVRHYDGEAAFSQRRWAERERDRPHAAAVDQMLTLIKQYPGKITLLAVGPLTNVAAALDRDASTMNQLKRVVIMGGSVRRGYDDLGYTPDHGPDVEYNVAMDPEAAQKVFGAGIPHFIVPLDSSQDKLDEVKRRLLFAYGSRWRDAIALLYPQWSAATRNVTPTMFDVVAAGYVVDPKLCPMTPLHIEVTAKGATQEIAGTPNAQVCLSSSQDLFFTTFMPRLLSAPGGIASAAKQVLVHPSAFAIGPLTCPIVFRDSSRDGVLHDVRCAGVHSILPIPRRGKGCDSYRSLDWNRHGKAGTCPRPPILNSSKTRRYSWPGSKELSLGRYPQLEGSTRFA